LLYYALLCFCNLKLGTNQSTDALKLRQFIRFNARLISSYLYVNEELKINDAIEDSEKLDVTSLSELTQVNENSLNDYFKFKREIDLRLPKTNSKNVRFSDVKEPDHLEIAKYIGCFEIDLQQSQATTNKTNITEETYPIESSSSEHKYQLNKSITLKDKQALGEFMFAKFLKQHSFDSIAFEKLVNLVPLKNSQMLVS
jgi:hypothetical protein